mmetsp:Transcript_6297/g.13606  ORF Transcript_6297/g.13606 Transcript_6297/m.13606 type:complete len:498 (+) Transcript_6297:147-1640(+)
MLVPERDAIREGNATPVIPTYPKPTPLDLAFHVLQLLHYVEVSQFVLWNGCRPDLDAQYLGRRRIRLQQHLSQVLVHGGNDVLVRHGSDGGIARPSDVIQQNVVVLRTPFGKQARAPQGAQRAHALGPGVERSEAREILKVAEFVIEFHVLERGFGVCHRDGRDGGVVDAFPVDGCSLFGEEMGGAGQDGFEDVVHGVRGHGGDDRLGFDGFWAIGRIVGGHEVRSLLLYLFQGPFQLDFVRTQLVHYCVWQGAQPSFEAAWIAVLEVHPVWLRGIRFPLLGQLDLPGQSAVEERAELVPFDVVGVLFDPRYFGQCGLHAERGGISGVHAADEGVNDAVEDLVAEDATDPILDGLLLALGGSGVSHEGSDASANLAGPGEEVADQAEFEHAVPAEDEFDLALGTLATLTLGKGVELAVVVHPWREGLIGEDELVVDSQFVGDAHDGRLGREGIGTLLVNEFPIIVVHDYGLDVAAQIISAFRQDDIEVRFVQIVCER